MNKYAVCFVAHPDDCLIFARNFILSHSFLKWKIVYLTYTEESRRGAEVNKVWGDHGVECHFLGFSDLPQGEYKKENNIEPNEVLAAFNVFAQSIDILLLLTHNEIGEYGHPHHKLVHLISKEIKCPKVTFSHFLNDSNLKIKTEMPLLVDELPIHRSALLSFNNRFDFLSFGAYHLDEASKVLTSYLQTGDES